MTGKADPKVAVKAVENFKRMIPSLEGFATALAGKPLRIVPSSDGTYSDGQTLHIRPPYALGIDEERHVRSVCGTRDRMGFALCPACERRERVISLVYHEMSHIIFGSFVEHVNQHYLTGLFVASGLRDYATEASKHFDATIDRDSPLAVSSVLLGHMGPMLVNAVEDSRVDALMAEARPGVYDMQVATRQQIMDEVKWIEQPLDVQATIAPLLVAEDFDYKAHLHEYLSRALSDPNVEAIIRSVYSATCVEDSIVIAARYVEAMKDYGFFGGRPEEERPVEGGDEGDEDSEEDGEREGGEGEGNGDPSGDAEDSEDGVQPKGPAEDSEGGGGGSDEEADESSGDGGDDARFGGEPAGEGEGSASCGTDEDGSGGGGGSPQTAHEDEVASEQADAGSVPSGDDDSEGESRDGGASGGGAADTEAAESGEADDLPDLNEGGEVGHGGRPEPEEFTGSNPRVAEKLAAELVEKLVGHVDQHIAPDTRSERKMIESVMGTSDYFDEPSVSLTSVKVEKKLPPARKALSVDETILGPALLHLRKAMEENKRARYDRNRKSGRVSASTLGRRAWNDDPRLFHKKSLPGKRDYAVVIGIDISGSTAWGSTLSVELKAAHAQAELCSRMGIKFAVFAHSGSVTGLIIKEVKTFEAPWNDEARKRLAGLRAAQANYDGHTLQFYRKTLDRVQATDKIIMYYSDGEMPAENYDEELALLKKEIKTCRQRGYVLMGVGIGSNDPQKHGLDSVRVDGMEDVIKVVRHLGKRLEEL